jgi:hypothetical protein
VLFSREDVASFINQNFEAAWQSVRPAPIVRVDFGNGTVVTRTLHGNIATYVCAADGQVLDILPGIYTPDVYVNRLEQLRFLATYVDQNRAEGRQLRLLRYHQDQAEALAKNDAGPQFVKTAGVSKARIEGPMEIVLLPASEAKDRRRADHSGPAATAPHLDRSKDVELWKRLVEDTRQSENIRRRQVHEILAWAKPVRPDQIAPKLYKEVLHSDFADPYLGLGQALFAHYPFASEDKPRSK